MYVMMQPKLSTSLEAREPPDLGLRSNQLDAVRHREEPSVNERDVVKSEMLCCRCRWRARSLLSHEVPLAPPLLPWTPNGLGVRGLLMARPAAGNARGRRHSPLILMPAQPHWPIAAFCGFFCPVVWHHGASTASRCFRLGIACVSLSTLCGADDSDAGTSALAPRLAKEHWSSSNGSD